MFILKIIVFLTFYSFEVVCYFLKINLKIIKITFCLDPFNKPYAYIQQSILKRFI